MFRNALCSAALASAFVLAAPAGAQNMAQPGAPVWAQNVFLQMGGVFMRRGNEGDRNVVVNDGGVTCRGDFCPSLLRTDAIGAFDDFRGGIDAKAGVRLADNIFLVVRALWISEFEGTASLTGPGNLGLPFTNDISTNFDGANSATITRTSNFFSAVAGPQMRVNSWLTVGAGFRYVRMTDNISIVMTDSAAATYDLRTRNQMLGGELNAVVKWPVTTRFLIIVHGSAGFLHNSARVNNDTFDPSDSRANRSAVATRNGFSFLGEIGLNGSFALESWLHIFAGYRVMWITGVATATHNLDFNSVPGRIAQTITAEHGANVLYHGGIVGVKVIF